MAPVSNTKRVVAVVSKIKTILIISFLIYVTAYFAGLKARPHIGDWNRPGRSMRLFSSPVLLRRETQPLARPRARI